MGCCKKIPVRYYIMLMIFFSTYINYTTRSNVALSLSAMVKIIDKGKEMEPICKAIKKSTDSSEGTTVSDNVTTVATTAIPEKDDRFQWTQAIQGQVLSGYFYGYVPGSLPAGYIAERFGPFWTLFCAIALAGVLNSLCVWVVAVHWSIFLVCRIIIGAAGGLVYPALQCLIGRWAPPNERGKFVASMMGNTLGTCVTWALVGPVSKDWGWRWGYHVVSVQHVPLLILMWFLVYDSPEQHKWITEEEIKFIKDAQAGNVSKTKSTPPYRKMLLSRPFWMLNLLHIGNLYGLYVQMQSVPKFMVEFIGYNIKKSGIVAALPNLVRFFAGIGYGALGDYLKTHKYNREIVLKVGVVFSHVVPGVLMGCMGLVGCKVEPAVVLLVLSCAINGAAVLTNLSNPTDLSPNFCGTIFGIISFIGGSTGFIVPQILSGMLDGMGNKKPTWTWFFVIGGTVYVATGVIFILLGTSKTQPWNEKKEDQDAAAQPVATKS